MRSRSVVKSTLDETRPLSDRSERGRSSLEGVVTIREINHGDSRALVDINETHSVWKKGADAAETFGAGEMGSGAIVRLCPPANVTDAELAQIEQVARDAGAVAVKVQRREVIASGVVGASDAQGQDVTAPRTHREVIDALLARVNANGVLRAVVERAMEEGAKQAKPSLQSRGSEPLYVKTIRLMNWQRFRGRHEIPLEPTVYAITAEHEEQPGRSNWLGKSTLLGSIPFAFFGWHTRPREDAWITDGEDEGGVAIVLSDGTTMQRARVRGKATRIVLRRADGTQAHGDEAEREIIERLGLVQLDFFSSSFFIQKTIGQFVTMQPAKRQELVAGWLDLGPLRAAEEWTREMLDGAAEREGKAREQATTWKREIQTIEQSFGNPGGPMQLEATIEQLIHDREASLKQAQERAGAVRAAGQVAKQRDAIARAQAARARAEAEFIAATKEAEGIDRIELQAKVDAARSAQAEAGVLHNRAATDETEKRRLRVVGFDGKCPVASITCPATEEINARRTEAEARLQEATKQKAICDVAYETAMRAAQEAEQALRAGDQKIQAVREKRRAFEQAQEQVDSLGPMPPELLATETAEQLDARVRELAREVEMYRASIARLARAKEETSTAEALAVNLAQEAAVFGQAARLLGRGEGGAQREIALAALGAIEASTNASLAASGVDLTVALRWGTESSTELATYCNACGTSFPSSKRVKSCARCGAARGPKLDEKLDFALSDRSGAADDLAGFHLQMAAASWLYGRRGVAWRVMAVDEPFGALDEVHRKAMGVHVAGLLRSKYAFEQAFVIAHDPASTDAMPARIRIIAGRDGSRVEVES